MGVGSYMKALDPKVLLSALGIQDELLGTTINFNPRKGPNATATVDVTASLTPDMRDAFHAVNGISDLSWFFHSPLQYWACDKERIVGDRDIISTVNQGSRQATSVNVTLRHSIVFSGKRFEDHRLVAADALVITLIHMLDSPVGRQWDRKAKELALRTEQKWKLYPADGRPSSSTLYEFRFQPLSLQDDILLGTVYSAIVIYFLYSLAKLRALKSRLGLILAVISQIAVSIMSSFTICAVLKIDLSKIPREVYPLVVLTIGLENIFRLINAVIITPSSASTASRISEALGQTGHIALAGVAQNLIILWTLSKAMAPQISAFCTFAAVALMFDFFYLLTFFTAVLSVDVRRTELSDSLTRATALNSRPSSPEDQVRNTFFDALWRGEATFSTRIAGTIVMTGFILIAQSHFFDNETLLQSARRVVRLLKWEPQLPRTSAQSFLSVDINQARTPTAWLRMQDHETARDIIQVVKPNANRYIARVYEPLVIVLNGSDRTPNQSGVRPFLPAAYDFARNQFGVFIVTVIVIVAAVSMLMNYLLWDESPDDEEDGRPADEPLLSVRTLSHGHSLDIVHLATSREGVIASIGLDRLVRIWDIRGGVMGYIVQDLETHVDPFPVVAIAIDRVSNWLAILSGKDRVYLWNIPERRWGPSMAVVVKGRKPAAFFFGYDKTEIINPLYIVRHNGLMTELRVEAEESTDTRICHSPLVCVRQHFEKPNATSPNPVPRIITSSKKGCIHIASQLEAGWTSDAADIPCPLDDQAILSVVALPELSCFLAARSRSVDLVDITTHKIMYTFATEAMKTDTLRCFHSTRRRPQCGSVGIASLALAYTSFASGNVILQTYLPEREGDTICFRDERTPGSRTCCLPRETIETRYEVENPGDWDALPVGYLVGIRKREPSPKSQPSTTTLRQRIKPPHSTPHKQAEDDTWEVWSLSPRGERTLSPLCGYAERDNLLVNELGPMKLMGRRTLVVGLGNVVKVCMIGKDDFEGGSEGDEGVFVGMVKGVGRRKKSRARKD